VLATNLSVIARGECTFEELAYINAHLETLLGNEGAYLDRVYFCPHHPDAGYPGERSEYKTVCSCRKPAPGMLLKAARDMNIDLSLSYMVGDSVRDRQTGINAGCTPVLLSCGKKESEAEGLADYPDLLSFCKTL
jgi:D-glycero-D-manno-heptose 1,7-bisphosphate phosphatase